MGSPQGFYVYELVDPRDGQAFYVGKGRGFRAWQHEKQALSGAGINQEKCKRIVDINEAGLSVEIRIISESLEEDAAYAMERELIALRRDILTNVADGGVVRRSRVVKPVIEKTLKEKPLLPYYTLSGMADAERTLDETALYLLNVMAWHRKNSGPDDPPSAGDLALLETVNACFAGVESITGKPWSGDEMGYRLEFLGNV